MTRPAPTVTVPVDTFNGDNAALVASISALLETPDTSLSARVPGMAKQLLASAAARLTAAPAAPQAAGVGEEWTSDIEWLREAARYFQKRDTKGEDAAFWSNLKNSENANRIADKLEALRAQSREPEGGAVDDGAFKIATDLHKAYEQLIYGLPKYLDAENLTDEENMIREAWVTLDVTAHRLAALATREEAPACEMCNGRGEVGGPTGQTPESFDYVTERCPDCGGTGKVEAPADHHERNLSMTNDELIGQALSHLPLEAPAEAGERIVGTIAHVSNGRSELPELIASALRAQPQAREDAQPVALPLEGAPRDGTMLRLRVRYEAANQDEAWTPLEDSEESWTIGFNNFDNTGDDRWQFVGWDWSQDHLLEATGGAVIGWLPFHTHLAPDALRVALADLASWFTKPVQGQNGMVWVIPAGEMGADDAVNAALAALQAEQGAK